jgi:hypothetical protein
MARHPGGGPPALFLPSPPRRWACGQSPERGAGPYPHRTTRGVAGPSLHRGGLLRAEPRRALNSCMQGLSGGRSNIFFALRLSDWRVSPTGRLRLTKSPLLADPVRRDDDDGARVGRRPTPPSRRRRRAGGPHRGGASLAPHRCYSRFALLLRWARPRCTAYDSYGGNFCRRRVDERDTVPDYPDDPGPLDSANCHCRHVARRRLLGSILRFAREVRSDGLSRSHRAEQ